MRLRVLVSVGMWAWGCSGVAIDSPSVSGGGATAEGGGAGNGPTARGGRAGNGAGPATQGGTAGDGGAPGEAAGDGGMGGEGPPEQRGSDGGAQDEAAGAAGAASETTPLDCSDRARMGSTGDALPDICNAAKTCTGAVDLAELPVKDLIIQLPPAAAQDPVACSGALVYCAGGEGELHTLTGLAIAQLTMTWPLGQVVHVETDDQRTLLWTNGHDSCPGRRCFDNADRSDNPLFNGLTIVSKPNAPSGWVRIQLDAPMSLSSSMSLSGICY